MYQVCCSKVWIRFLFSKLKPRGNGWPLVHCQRTSLHIGRLYPLHGKIPSSSRVIVHNHIKKSWRYQDCVKKIQSSKKLISEQHANSANSWMKKRKEKKTFDYGWLWMEAKLHSWDIISSQGLPQIVCRVPLCCG